MWDGAGLRSGGRWDSQLEHLISPEGVGGCNAGSRGAYIQGLGKLNKGNS